jgi:hypothetical protein
MKRKAMQISFQAIFILFCRFPKITLYRREANADQAQTRRLISCHVSPPSCQPSALSRQILNPRP